jgi:diguanylate cyclase (GGDEF)-like protein/PAS domain S-box-containing protein
MIKQTTPFFALSFGITCLATIVFLLLPARPCAAENILILHSYHRGYPWTDDVKAGMEEILKQHIPEAELFVENMDTKRHPPEQIFERLRSFLSDKYAGTIFDVILCSDDNALDFLLKYRNELFPKIPVVFCGINDFGPGRIAGHENITGVAENYDLEGTLDIALQLHPQTRTVAIITDGTPTGQANLAKARRIIPHFRKRVAFQLLDSLNAPELVKALSSLPPRSIVLNLLFLRDPEGHIYTPSQSNRLIVKNSRHPVYTPWDFLISDGVVGGHVVSGKRQGQTAARLALRILHGEEPSHLPPLTQTPNLYIFDNNALQRFGIDRQKLPMDSVILNDIPLIGQEYKRQATVALSLTGIFVCFTFALGLMVMRYKKTLQALRHSEGTVKAILESISDPIHMIDRELNIIWANDIAKRMFGKDLVGQKCHVALHRSPTPCAHPCHAMKAFDDGAPHNSESLFFDANGEQRCFLVTANVAAKNGEDAPEAVLAISRDVTALKKTQQQFKMAQKAIDASLTPLIMVDLQGHLTYVNRAALDLWGYQSEQEVLDKHIVDFHEDPQKARAIFEILKNRGVWNGEGRGKKKNGICFDVQLQAQVIKNENGAPLSVMASVVDITDKKKAEAQIKHLAYFDGLTGLPNKTLLKDHMDLAIGRARRLNKFVAVLLLDLDNFKHINDTLGHTTGDMLIQAVAERLRKVIRSCDTLARWGGDEFVLVLSDLDDIQKASAATEKFLRLLNEKPFVTGEGDISTTASIGIALYPQDGLDSDTLLKQADTAMYEAKKKGRNDYHFFSSQLAQQADQRHRMEVNLRKALKQEEMFLVYQPQIDLALGRVTGMEALVRWQHPDDGLIPPSRFIPLAEETGLIRPLGEWILRTACSKAALWGQETSSPLSIAVNISAKQFHQPDLVKRVGETLHSTSLPPQLLELELTESVFLENTETAVEALKALKNLGIRIAIDDFGTGYSSLTYLKKLPIDRIKIAQEFVRDIDTDEGDKAIVKATIAMAKSLGMKLIAEGVENHQQLRFLLSQGCCVMQGYYFAKPMSADHVIPFVHNEKKIDFGWPDWF